MYRKSWWLSGSEDSLNSVIVPLRDHECIILNILFIYIYIYIYKDLNGYIIGVARYMYSYRTVTVQASRFGAWGFTMNTGNSPPIQKGVLTVMQRCLITASRRTANVPTGCQVSNAGTDVFCVCARALRHDHFNCFLIPAESTLNTYCLINNHCIKVCFYLCTLTMKTKQIVYI